MCSARIPHIVCTVGLSTIEHCVSVHLVLEDFGLASLPQNCWEDFVVDLLPTVDYCLGSGISYSWLSLVGYWGLTGWGFFVVQTPVPTEQVELGQGLEPLALVVHSIFGWVVVPQMWAFARCIVFLAKPRPDPTVVAQVVHKKLWLRTGTSFLNSLEFGFGR